MKKIVITGVTGFIGSHLCYKFLEMGYEVIGIGRKENARIVKIKNKNFTFMKVDAINFDMIKNADIFYHLAWNAEIYNTKDNVIACNGELENIKMTCEMVNKIIQSNVKKIVFIGSISEVGYYFDKERNITNIKSRIYGMAKNFASDICQKLAFDNNISFNSVMLANTYGSNDYSNKAVSQFIKKMVKNENLDLIEPNDLADWVYIDDTVNGLVAVGEKGINFKKYYIGHRKIKTFKEYILELKNVLNSSSVLNFGIYHEVMGYDYSKINLDELYNDTGFECKCDFKESILSTTQWMEKEGLLDE